jgi:hypothetical protein
MLIMLAVATVAGPINFILGFVLWLWALSVFPPDSDLRQYLEGPLVILTQAAVACLVIFLTLTVVTRFTDLPRSWGYAVGIMLAVVTNPMVLVLVSSTGGVP